MDLHFLFCFSKAVVHLIHKQKLIYMLYCVISLWKEEKDKCRKMLYGIAYLEAVLPEQCSTPICPHFSDSLPFVA